MYRYAYDNCPVCGLTFTEDDDVVVCPTCGTPHHRECYKNSGGCAHEEQHNEGFTFVSAAPADDDSSYNNTAESSAESDPNNSQESSQANPFESDTFNSPFGHVITDNETINDVPVGDLKKFIGPAWMYYIPLFYAKIKGLRIFRINLSAMLGSYAWLLSRKFYLLGIVSALINFISYFFMNFYEAYAKNSGAELTIDALLSNKDPYILIGYFIYVFVSNIPFVLRILTGIFANKLYMNKCIKTVKQINHSSENAEQFNAKLSKKGGLSMVLLFLSAALYASYIILVQRGVIMELMTQLVNFIF